VNKADGNAPRYEIGLARTHCMSCSRDQVIKALPWIVCGGQWQDLPKDGVKQMTDQWRAAAHRCAGHI
jgi:hypothetical protein